MKSDSCETAETCIHSIDTGNTISIVYCRYSAVFDNLLTLDMQDVGICRTREATRFALRAQVDEEWSQSIISSRS